MTVVARTWRIGIIGMSPAGLFLLERLSLAPDMHLVGVFDQDHMRRDLAANVCDRFWDQPLSAFTSAETDAVFLMDGVSADLIFAGILHGKHVVVHQPWLLSSGELRSLAEKGAKTNCVATMTGLRRWSSGFAAASAAKKSGRLGALQSVRVSSCEMSLSPDASFAGVLREFGFDWLDQLLLLAESTPTRVFAKRFQTPGQAYEHGILTTIEFESGCTAQIDLQTQSRLAHQTGWMLEGSTGSYRGDRMYTMTPDGEIVDEPLSRPALPAEPLIGELALAWQGQPTTLPTLADAARVVQLIEMIEQSMASGEVIRL